MHAAAPPDKRGGDLLMGTVEVCRESLPPNTAIDTTDGRDSERNRLPEDPPAATRARVDAIRRGDDHARRALTVSRSGERVTCAAEAAGTLMKRAAQRRSKGSRFMERGRKNLDTAVSGLGR